MTNSFTSRYLPMKTGKHMPMRQLGHTCLKQFYLSCSPQTEIVSKRFINRWTDKQMVAHSSNNMLLGNKKELKACAHGNTDEACLC